MIEPIIIQRGRRRSVINGNTLSLERMRTKRTATGVWPETVIIDNELRLYAAFAWAAKGHIEIPGLKN